MFVVSLYVPYYWRCFPCLLKTNSTNRNPFICDCLPCLTYSSNYDKFEEADYNEDDEAENNKQNQPEINESINNEDSHLIPKANIVPNNLQFEAENGSKNIQKNEESEKINEFQQNEEINRKDEEESSPQKDDGDEYIVIQQQSAESPAKLQSKEPTIKEKEIMSDKIEKEVVVKNEEYDNKEEESEEESEEEDNLAWYDEMAEISSFIKKKNKKNDLEFKSSVWLKLNEKKKLKLDNILNNMSTFISDVTTFDLRLAIWERTFGKFKKQAPTKQALPKLLYQLCIEFIRQKNKKQVPPTEKSVKHLMGYIAREMVNLENYSNNLKQNLINEKFAQGIDNWMTAIKENYEAL